MAVAGAAAGASAAALVEHESCITSFCEAVKLIITNKRYDAEDFKKRDLFLSEAYCLLWHNSGTGGVDGRKSSLHLRTGAFAAVLVDLFALGKINIVPDSSRLQCVNFENLVVKLKDGTPTGTYLDVAVFNHMIAQQHKHPNQPRSLSQWLELADHSCCVSITLSNLVKRGILGDVHTGFFGVFHKYPTLNPSAEQALEVEMKGVALKEQKPDSFMLGILTLSRTADNFFSFVDPVLEKHFSKKEYKIAKENIKVIVQSQGTVLRSPKLERKKLRL